MFAGRDIVDQRAIKHLFFILLTNLCFGVLSRTPWGLTAPPKPPAGLLATFGVFDIPRHIQNLTQISDHNLAALVYAHPTPTHDRRCSLFSVHPTMTPSWLGAPFSTLARQCRSLAIQINRYAGDPISPRFFAYKKIARPNRDANS